MSDAVTVVWDEALLGYTMGGEHPLHPVRLDLTMRLADALGVLNSDRIEIAKPSPAGVGHGLGTPDNPIFEGMYDAAALIAGGSVLAAQQVHAGTAQHAVNISGGLHHAMRDAASGICVFTDAAIAFAWLLRLGFVLFAFVVLVV